MYSQYDEERRIRVARAEIKAREKRERKKRRKIIVRVLVVAAIVFFLPARNFIQNTALPFVHYWQGERLESKGAFSEAAACFARAGAYRDAEFRVLDVSRAEGESLLEQAQYADAYRAFLRAGDTSEAVEGAKAAAYGLAKAALESKTYSLAAYFLNAAGDYRDAETLLAEYAEYFVDVGDAYVFGTYEQDGDVSNGAEPLVWRVLEIDVSSIMLITEQCVDCVPYDTTGKSVTWETSEIRAWLRDEFYMSAFTDDERASILLTRNENPDNAQWKTNGGNATEDYVYLLGIDEANAYFARNADRRAAATPYAVSRGAYFRASSGNGWWWLRSPGRNSRYALRVYDNGMLNLKGIHAGVDFEGVRPVIRVAR